MDWIITCENPLEISNGTDVATGEGALIILDALKPKTVNIGEIFSVEGKMYMISKPTLATDSTNEHNQIVNLVFNI